MGALHDAVKAAGTENERAAIKAQAWADENVPAGYNFNYRGYKVELTVQMDATSGNVVFEASLEQGGTDYTPADLNPITIVNPGYMVPDAGGDIEIETTDLDGNPVIIHASEDVQAKIIAELQHIGDTVIDAL